MNTVTDLQNMLQAARSFAQEKADTRTSAQELKFTPDSTLVLPPTALGSLPPLTVTEHGYSQLFAKLGPSVFGRGSARSLPKDYLLAVPADLRADILNRHLRDSNGRWLVRQYQATARAILGSDYTVMDNLPLLERLEEACQERGYPKEFKDPLVTPDDLHLRAVWGYAEGGLWGIGLYVGNNEIGSGKIKVKGLLKRTACDNSLIWTMDSAVEFIHRGDASIRWTAIARAVVEALKLGPGILRRAHEAEATEIPNFDEVLNGLAETYGWTPPQALSVATGTENQRTVMGVLNGLTWFAHNAELPPEERVRWESLAGDVLTGQARLPGVRFAAQAAEL